MKKKQGWSVNKELKRDHNVEEECDSYKKIAQNH